MTKFIYLLKVQERNQSEKQSSVLGLSYISTIFASEGNRARPRSLNPFPQALVRRLALQAAHREGIAIAQCTRRAVGLPEGRRHALSPPLRSVLLSVLRSTDMPLPT